MFVTSWRFNFKAKKGDFWRQIVHSTVMQSQKQGDIWNQGKFKIILNTSPPNCLKLYCDKLYINVLIKTSVITVHGSTI